ncbi:MAG: threonine synthase, partial [Calditrichia bacterium]|nr:threonine synthase [Calditrichia bacterium]
NFYRILDMYNHDLKAMHRDITGFSYSDDQTRQAIKKVYQEYNYVLDPHGAVGYLGVKEYLKKQSSQVQGIFLETAHPAKFIDVVQQLVSQNIEIPERLSSCMKKEKEAILLSKEYKEFKQYLYEN